MTEFAAHIWSVSKPSRNNNTFGTVLMLRNATVNYCPFCGVRWEEVVNDTSWNWCDGILRN
jgi:hypothetical protein